MTTTEDHIYHRIARAVNAKIDRNRKAPSPYKMSFAEAERCCEYLKNKGLAVQTYGDAEFIANTILAVDPVWGQS